MPERLGRVNDSLKRLLRFSGSWRMSSRCCNWFAKPVAVNSAGFRLFLPPRIFIRMKLISILREINNLNPKDLDAKGNWYSDEGENNPDYNRVVNLLIRWRGIYLPELQQKYPELKDPKLLHIITHNFVDNDDYNNYEDVSPREIIEYFKRFVKVHATDDEGPFAFYKEYPDMDYDYED